MLYSFLVQKIFANNMWGREKRRACWKSLTTFFICVSIQIQKEDTQRLNMESDIQSLFGLLAHSFTHWLRLRPRRNLTSPPHLDSYMRALLVSPDRRQLQQNSLAGDFQDTQDCWTTSYDICTFLGFLSYLYWPTGHKAPSFSLAYRHSYFNEVSQHKIKKPNL